MSSFRRFKERHQKVEVEEFENRVSTPISVSVVITTYNQGSYISTCLDHVLSQETNFDFEIIIGDDQSTDGTREICIDYANRHPDKIRLLLHSRKNNIEINGSPSGRFNFLYSLSQARGKYIAFCEGDDYWIDNQKLQKQFDALENNTDCSLCFHAHFEEGKRGRKKVLNFNKECKISTKEAILGGGGLMASNAMFFHRSYLDDFPEWMELAPIGDGPIVIFLSTKGKLLYLTQVMSVYRIFAQNSWSNSMKNLKNRKRYFFSVMRMWNEINSFLAGRYKNYIFIKKFKTIVNFLLGRF